MTLVNELINSLLRFCNKNLTLYLAYKFAVVQKIRTFAHELIRELFLNSHNLLVISFSVINYVVRMRASREGRAHLFYIGVWSSETPDIMEQGSRITGKRDHRYKYVFRYNVSGGQFFVVTNSLSGCCFANLLIVSVLCKLDMLNPSFEVEAKHV